MGFFDFFRREKRAAEPECDDILLRAIITGEPLSEETAMTIPVFSACVDFIACTIAGLPVKLTSSIVYALLPIAAMRSGVTATISHSGLSLISGAALS